MESKTFWTFLATFCLLAHGCGDAGTGAAELASVGTPGGGSMLDCESDMDCPPGEECEFEHGDSFCKPHGGGDHGTGGTGGDGTGGDGGMTMDCESDLDCPAGEECEFEHGGSYCKPHGGDHDDCDEDDDTDHDHDHDEDHGDYDRSGSNSGKG